MSKEHLYKLELVRLHELKEFSGLYESFKKAKKAGQEMQKRDPEIHTLAITNKTTGITFFS